MGSLWADMSEDFAEFTKILVVDDDQDTRDLLQFMLEENGATITVASSAQEALLIFEQVAPDLIISDVGMPGMSGYELIQQIRTRPNGATPAIALTAYARDEDRHRALEAGFNDYITKPVDPLELIDRVQRYCKRS